MKTKKEINFNLKIITISECFETNLKVKFITNFEYFLAKIHVIIMSFLFLSSLFLPFFFSIFLSSLFLSLSLTFLIFSRSFPFPFFPFREEVLWTKFSNLGACQLKFVAVGVKISKFFSKGVLSNNFSALFHEMGPLQTTGESYVKMGLQVFTSPCPMF